MSDPAACTSASSSGCAAIPIDPQTEQFLNLMPASNGPDNGDGTGELITADKGNTREDHGMVRIDQNFSDKHSIFARYTIDDSSSLAPYVGTPPGTYMPGFAAIHLARNQYVSIQDRSTFATDLINELRFGVNRTTASSSADNAHPGLSISLLPDRAFGTRKGSRGRSNFDIRHNFVANASYQLPGSGRLLGGWQLAAVAGVHSGPPFTPMLSFDNADVQSLLIPERPNLVGNPYAGACPNGARVGAVACWFNPGAFAVPPPLQFGNAGRNMLRGPGFAQFDPSLHKDLAIVRELKIMIGVEAYTLFNHPNFGVPSNTQSPLSLGGNGDAVFKDAAGDHADNVGQILTTAGTARQFQLVGRFIF